ncbi:MAG: nucleotidyltransferase domain-containing protein [Acidobacteria bacterium]|nr:nucleotidyltransferase domain-containing protein [Acidobacteriota bacterium]
MPVRSLSSSVFRWPDRKQVDRAVRVWVAEEVQEHPQLCRLGYFGSYARGDWGVGSDLDIIAIVQEASEPFERRSRAWDLGSLPVPAEILVYTKKEWERLAAGDGLFSRRMRREVIWIYSSDFETQCETHGGKS